MLDNTWRGLRRKIWDNVNLRELGNKTWRDKRGLQTQVYITTETTLMQTMRQWVVYWVVYSIELTVFWAGGSLLGSLRAGWKGRESNYGPSVCMSLWLQWKFILNDIPIHEPSKKPSAQETLLWFLPEGMLNSEEHTIAHCQYCKVLCSPKSVDEPSKCISIGGHI